MTDQSSSVWNHPQSPWDSSQVSWIRWAREAGGQRQEYGLAHGEKRDKPIHFSVIWAKDRLLHFSFTLPWRVRLAQCNCNRCNMARNCWASQTSKWKSVFLLLALGYFQKMPVWKTSLLFYLTYWSFSEKIEAIRLEEAVLLVPFIQGLCAPCYPQVLLALTLFPQNNNSNEKYIPALILSFAISGATIQLSSFLTRDHKRQQPEKQNATPRIFLLYFRVTLRAIKQNITGITPKKGISICCINKEV